MKFSKVFFHKVIKPQIKAKLKVDLGCRVSLSTGKILVRKIGNPTFNNEVWPGRVVNNTFKLLSLNNKIKHEYKDNPRVKDGSLFIVSEKVYKYLKTNHKKFALESCDCGEKSKDLWIKFPVEDHEEVEGKNVYFLSANLCEKCEDEVIKQMLL